MYFKYISNKFLRRGYLRLIYIVLRAKSTYKRINYTLLYKFDKERGFQAHLFQPVACSRFKRSGTARLIYLIESTGMRVLFKIQSKRTTRGILVGWEEYARAYFPPERFLITLRNFNRLAVRTTMLSARGIDAILSGSRLLTRN